MFVNDVRVKLRLTPIYVAASERLIKVLGVLFLFRGV